jgi:hypothetical protein
LRNVMAAGGRGPVRRRDRRSAPSCVIRFSTGAGSRMRWLSASGGIHEVVRNLLDQLSSGS